MYEPFLKYISAHAKTPLTGKDIELIKKTFVPKKLRKRQYFLQEGDVCKYFGFIVSGSMRQYSIDDNGVEHIVALLVENWWVGDRESFINLTPSVYNIDACEDTMLLQATRADQLGELASIPAINEMSRYLDENFAMAAQRRFNAQISLPAEKRYSLLVESYPEFQQRFPQHYIASYLGITKETLSRIRTQALKK